MSMKKVEKIRNEILAECEKTMPDWDLVNGKIDWLIENAPAVAREMAEICDRKFYEG